MSNDLQQQQKHKPPAPANTMNDQHGLDPEDPDAPNPRVGALLHRRQELTDALAVTPYDLILFLERAVVYADLAYPDLAAGDAYRALLLTDEVLDDSFEYHEEATSSLARYSVESPPDVLRHGALDNSPRSSTTTALSNGASDAASNSSPNGLNGLNGTSPHVPSDSPTEDGGASAASLARLASTRCFQILSVSLLLCGCLRSAHDFCERGLAAAPSNQELLDVRGYIATVARRRLRKQEFQPDELPDAGTVRREVYPWNRHEPDRFSRESLEFLNGELAAGIAPKCEVRVSELPVLLEGASNTDGYDIIPTCSQLGIFAREAIAPGEVVLREYSALTANNRLQEPVCDACGEELPPLGAAQPAVPCPECADTVFCSDECFDRAQALYHPAVCDKDVDSIAKDPDAADVDHSLYLLLLARLLAMAAHQGRHPLDVREVRYIWGDFVPSRANDIDLSPNAGPPPDWTLPFSFRFNIEIPLHVLEKMDVDIYATLDRHDVWVLNTCYAKFRGTASARKSTRDGRPDVAAVHPFWCLANHDCDPNVTWEWGGRMVLKARESRVVEDRDREAGLRAGDEVLNHYCDVSLPVQQRREWARGSLGGWCMCQRCRSESAEGEMRGVEPAA